MNISKIALKLISALFLSMLFLSTPSLALPTLQFPRRCAAVFEVNNNTLKRIEIPSAKAIRIIDQCHSAKCVVASEVSRIELDYLRTTGKVLELSEEFAFISSFLVKAETLATDTSTNAPINLKFDNSTQAESISMANGAIPKGLWHPKIPLDQWHLHYPAIAKDLDAAIQKWKRRQSYLKKVGRYMNLRFFMRREFRQILEKYFGPLPMQFVYEGRNWTPREFASEIVNRTGSGKAETIYYRWKIDGGALLEKVGTTRVPPPPTDGDERFRATVASIQQTLDRGLSVPVLYTHVDGFFKSEGGRPHYKYIAGALNFETLPNDKFSFHRALIIGYLQNSVDEVTGFITLSTHGLLGHDGKIEMDLAYFKNFMIHISLVTDSEQTQR